MERLNLPQYPLKIRKLGEKSLEVFDVIRRKWFQLTPEEWVRQHWIHHLQQVIKVPNGLISCESGHKLGTRTKRTDLLAWKDGNVKLLIECKAPKVAINQKTLDQALVYQKEYQADYLLLSNGKDHFVFKVNTNTRQLASISELPPYNSW